MTGSGTYTRIFLTQFVLISLVHQSGVLTCWWPDGTTNANTTAFIPQNDTYFNSTLTNQTNITGNATIPVTQYEEHRLPTFCDGVNEALEAVWNVVTYPFRHWPSYESNYVSDEPYVSVGVGPIYSPPRFVATGGHYRVQSGTPSGGGWGQNTGSSSKGWGQSAGSSSGGWGQNSGSSSGGWGQNSGSSGGGWGQKSGPSSGGSGWGHNSGSSGGGWGQRGSSSPFRPAGTAGRRDIKGGSLSRHQSSG